MATRTLNVEVIGASGLKNTEFLGKSDPFVSLTVGKETRKSKAAKDQPQNPVWNETFSLPVHDTDTELLVRILNDEFLHDDDMGRAVIPLASIHGGSYTASVFPLELKGKPHGEITMSLSFEGEEHHEDLAQKVQGLFVGEKKEHDHVDEVPHGDHHEEHHAGHSHHHGHHERQEKANEKKHRKEEEKHREFGEEAGLRIDDVEDEEKEKKYED